MGFIIKFFKSIWAAISTVFTWLVGVPGLVLSAITGAYTALTSLIDSFTTGQDLASELTESAAAPIESLVNVVDGLPDIVKLGFYSLSLDVGWDTLLAFWGLVFPLAIALLTFIFVSTIVYVANFYLIKLTAFGLASVLPSGWCPMGLKVFASWPITRIFYPRDHKAIDLSGV